MVEVFAAILGTVVGFLLNEFTSLKHSKPKLCFNMVGTTESELTERELRTKTSSSEYGVEVFNVGHNPFILESFSLYDGKKLLIDCFMDEQSRVILPYHSAVYTLMEQDLDSLRWHCQQSHFERCRVVAYSVDKKRAKGQMETPAISLFSKVAGVVPQSE